MQRFKKRSTVGHGRFLLFAGFASVSFLALFALYVVGNGESNSLDALKDTVETDATAPPARTQKHVSETGAHDPFMHERLEPVGLETPEDYKMRGVVLDADTGKKLVQCKIYGFTAKSGKSGWGLKAVLSERFRENQWDAFSPDARSRSDATGSFYLDSDHATGWLVAVRKNGFTPDIFGPFQARETADEPVVIKLHKNIPFRGKVMDADDRAVTGAQVRVWHPVCGEYRTPGLTVPDFATTDMNGEFELAGLGPFPLRVQVRKKGFPEYISDIDSHYRLREDIHIVRLPLGGEVSGRVKDKHGSVENAMVQISACAVGGIKETRTDVLGCYVFENVPAGIRFVNVSLDGIYSDRSTCQYECQLEVPDEGKVVQDFTLSTGACSRLSGIVTAGTLKIQSGYINAIHLSDGTNVRSSNSTAVINSKGEFDFPALSSGKYQLRVYISSDGRENITHDLTHNHSGPRDSYLPIKVPLGAIRGKVIDYETGKPLHDRTVSLLVRKDNRWKLERPPADGPQSTDRQGRYEIHGLAPGVYKACVCISTPGDTAPSEPVASSQEIKMYEGEYLSGIDLYTDFPNNDQCAYSTSHLPE